MLKVEDLIGKNRTKQLHCKRDEEQSYRCDCVGELNSQLSSGGRLIVVCSRRHKARDSITL